MQKYHIVIMILIILLCACSKPQEKKTIVYNEISDMKINVMVNNQNFTASLVENEAAQTFYNILKKAPLIVDMSDYAGFEKIGDLDISLPDNDTQMVTQVGDILLYNSNQIVMFYKPNSWSYTRLGKIDNLNGWTEALGNGDVTVIFSIKNNR